MFHIIHRILYECLKDDETDKKEKKILFHKSHHHHNGQKFAKYIRTVYHHPYVTHPEPDLFTAHRGFWKPGKLAGSTIC